MPRETVKIPILGAPPFEAASQVMSYIAYPDKLDRGQRAKFADALCRAAHLTNEHFHKGWYRSPQQIKPHIFQASDLVFRKSLHAGTVILLRRGQTSAAMLCRHLEALRTGKRPANFGDFTPTVDHIAMYLKEEFGWRDTINNNTFKDKIWGTTRPVAHMAYIIGWEFIDNYRCKILKEEVPVRDLFHWFFPSDEILYGLISMGETLRLKLPLLGQVRFKEEETVQFVAV